MKWLSLAAVVALAAAASADDKKRTPPIQLTIVAKSDKYKLDTGDKTPAEYKKMLDDAAKLQGLGKPVRPPKPPAVDLVLVLTNTTKEDITVYVGGDANVYSFELIGGTGAATLQSEMAFTADLKLPTAVTLGPGKTYEVPIKQLSDGFRGLSRHVYWTGPGEYKLSVKYMLSDKEGGKGMDLRSQPVKITVTDK